MSYTKYITFLLLLSYSVVLAQFTQSHKQKLAQYLADNVNNHRVSLGLTMLEPHKDLASAGMLHSIWMVKRRKLTHNQNNVEHKTPLNRVKVFTEDFERVGENILYTKPIRGLFTDEQLKKIARDMFRSWKNSPGHYANMISVEFAYQDFGFEYESKSKRIYATQVLGSKVIKMPNQGSHNAYGIKNGTSICDALIEQNDNIIVTLGNNVRIEGRSIVLYYHDKKRFKKIFKNEKDGIAVDLVLHNQLSCNGPNQLDSSPIYDGVLLKPVYTKDLISNNTSQSDYRIITKIGELPEAFVNQNFSANLVIIKEGIKCSYITPISIPQQSYNLKNVAPEVLSPTVSFLNQGIAQVIEIPFNFKVNESVPEDVPNFPELRGDLKKVMIRSFSSVEGNIKINEALHKERSTYIINFLRDHLIFNKEDVVVSEKENWKLFNYQLEQKGYSEIATLSIEEKRNFIQKNKDKWQAQLQAQRKSILQLFLFKKWNINDSIAANYNLINALYTQNNKLANLALAKMYQDGTFYDLLNQEFVQNEYLTNVELVQNISAFFIRDFEYYSLRKITRFVSAWLSEIDRLSPGAQKNLLNLYALTTVSLLQYWDANSNDLSLVLHPEKVAPLFDSYSKKEEIDPLYLNYHMACLYYFNQINNYEQLLTSFEYITDYYKEASLSLEDDIALSLFFNHWGVYSHSIFILDIDLKNNKVSEESIFILAQTANGYNYNTDDESRFKYHEKAIEMNKKRWCKWINQDIQYLREIKMKDLYCKVCN